MGGGHFFILLRCSQPGRCGKKSMARDGAGSGLHRFFRRMHRVLLPWLSSPGNVRAIFHLIQEAPRISSSRFLSGCSSFLQLRPPVAMETVRSGGGGGCIAGSSPDYFHSVALCKASPATGRLISRMIGRYVAGFFRPPLPAGRSNIETCVGHVRHRRFIRLMRMQERKSSCR